MSVLIRLLTVAPLAVAATAWGQQGSISTGFAGSSMTSPGDRGLFFDFTALQDLHVDSFEVHAQGAGGRADVQVWYKEGSFVGFEADPGPWVMLGQATVETMGAGRPTPVPVGGLHAEAGRTYGVFVLHVDTHSPIYYTAVATAANPVYSNDDARIDLGDGCLAVSTPFQGCSARPRGWNGTINYTLSGPACYPDCNDDGALDFFDFLCFQNAFLAQDPYADCDGDGQFTFFDFLCFQNEFLAGCP